VIDGLVPVCPMNVSVYVKIGSLIPVCERETELNALLPESIVPSFVVVTGPPSVPPLVENVTLS
jgi:hypothetical protein